MARILARILFEQPQQSRAVCPQHGRHGGPHLPGDRESAYRETGKDLPEGFKIHLAGLIKSDRLNKPYDELLPPDEVGTFI